MLRAGWSGMRRTQASHEIKLKVNIKREEPRMEPCFPFPAHPVPASGRGCPIFLHGTSAPPGFSYKVLLCIQIMEA